jgi:hypothetical protein
MMIMMMTSMVYACVRVTSLDLLVGSGYLNSAHWARLWVAYLRLLPLRRLLFLLLFLRFLLIYATSSVITRDSLVAAAVLLLHDLMLVLRVVERVNGLTGVTAWDGGTIVLMRTSQAQIVSEAGVGRSELIILGLLVRGTS